MTGNETVFEFVATDQTVQTYLNAAERLAVGTWQPAGTRWKIALHPGHPQGEPFYIRVTGNKDNSNVPKVDTVNHNADEYRALGNIKNWKKLKSELNATEQTVLTNFLAAAFDDLKVIAHRWWNNQIAPADPVVVVPAPAPTDKACTQANCNGRVPIFASGKAPCDTCFVYQ